MATFSIIAFEIPIALIGYAALSVLRQITFYMILNGSINYILRPFNISFNGLHREKFT